jgi:hypothetical protein
MTLTESAHDAGEAQVPRVEAILAWVPAGGFEQNLFRAQLHARLVGLTFGRMPRDEELREAVAGELTALRHDYPDFAPVVERELWAWLTSDS